MTLYAAAIFDLDGLLLDTERLSLASAYQALADFGLPRADGLFESLTGKDDATAMRIVADHFGAGFPLPAFRQRWHDLFHRQLDTGIPFRPGATELLDMLAGRGLPLALATSSQQAAADRKLALTGLDRYFGAVVTVNSVAAPKPAPDPYLRAAELLGRNPARCIAFEDSDTGAAAAHAAGMTVVQVPDMLQTDGRFAHHLADSLMDGARMAGLI